MFYLVDSQRVSISVEGSIAGGDHVPRAGVRVVAVQTERETSAMKVTFSKTDLYFSQWCLLEHHVVVRVVEGVASHHPHQPRMHQGSVGGPAQGLSRRFDAGQHPEGPHGGDRDGAVRT